MDENKRTSLDLAANMSEILKYLPPLIYPVKHVKQHNRHQCDNKSWNEQAVQIRSNPRQKQFRLYPTKDQNSKLDNQPTTQERILLGTYIAAKCKPRSSLDTITEI
uniref:Uncharacterized protein n=1 Tax=Opuntia streptacantha TaxID=393608 RepID=A0A7C8ZAI4_OPUST